MTATPPIDALRAAAARVLGPTGILAAYAHGSRIGGRPNQRSDLDVGYYLRRGAAALSLRDELRLETALTDAVGVTVDLRDVGDAPLDLRGRILEDGVRIYSGDDVARVALERELLARYHDYKGELRAMHETRLRVVAARGLSPERPGRG